MKYRTPCYDFEYVLLNENSNVKIIRKSKVSTLQWRDQADNTWAHGAILTAWKQRQPDITDLLMEMHTTPQAVVLQQTNKSEPDEPLDLISNLQEI